MRTLRHLVILSLVVVVAVFLAAPSAMAKKALTEDELDLITAAGQPVIVTGGTGTITFSDTSNFSMLLPTDAQSGLQALSLNNLVGENQLANAFNIQSTFGAPQGNQENTITQSWGSTKDLTFGFASVAGVSAPGGDGGDADAFGASGCGLAGSVKCGINYSKGGTATGGNGGNGSTSQGVLGVAVLSEYSDVNISGEGAISVDLNPVFSMTLDTTSQSNLAALIVNNVVGMNQVANALNISGGVLTMNSAGAGWVLGSNGMAMTLQSNTINQFRGTPYSRPAPPAIVGP
jgi:hypothetical protein